MDLKDIIESKALSDVELEIFKRTKPEIYTTVTKKLRHFPFAEIESIEIQVEILEEIFKC